MEDTGKIHTFPVIRGGHQQNTQDGSDETRERVPVSREEEETGRTGRNRSVTGVPTVPLLTKSLLASARVCGGALSHSTNARPPRGAYLYPPTHTNEQVTNTPK